MEASGGRQYKDIRVKSQLDGPNFCHFNLTYPLKWILLPHSAIAVVFLRTSSELCHFTSSTVANFGI